MGFIKLVVFGFIGLSIIYVSIAVYSKSVRRERLEDEFDANPPEGADAAARDTYIAEGMAAYHRSLRPKLIGLVYVVPLIVVSVIVYVINTN
ncbi:hypothetical protein [Yoonia sp.]|uniref:hypothetical protein n=1 Tax=Yoonia sp. TaxID=2212373 RepID=UPI0025D0C112|nr:hypothetical protein [Yoonia sp.]